ncbi:MAG: hypothetical protein A2849_01005 [Candidatus Taylorbacteria bacterium RIFCSPHIGHO2_01_FULL_51_15]|uniref:Uncharacterized protein n=1 Tax=Candidatus Taylorbacteria bacterium RIFCSPHIGHO2_01_FULL_51_15 TaxID=1802304 RepID=A0A1G2M8W1_9BACT|nr:MAG: hypothetical protein A2849_01005 [Candidatus Taylorbacteria bacterium RIFCSPHIGHO2_01_FULL_51_15]
MRKYSVHVWLVVFLLLLPFLGIPTGWKKTLAILTLLFIAVRVLLSHSRHYLEKDEMFSEAEHKVEGASQEQSISHD